MDDVKTKGASALDAQFTPGRLALLLLLLIFAMFPQALIGTQAFFYRDAGLFTYPLGYYIRNSIWHGEIPLWNPYNNCGIPLLAQWNTAVCYPLSAIYLLLPLPWSLNVLQFAHLIIAALGMYFLARRWSGSCFGAFIAGLAFAWNGLTLHSLIWISNLGAYAWMPWVLLAFEDAVRKGGRAIVIAGIIGAVQMLSGAPEIIGFTWLIAIGMLIVNWRSEPAAWRRGLAVVGIVLGLSAVQLMPFIDLLLHSQRSASSGSDAWAMPIWGWANFLVPLFRSTPSIIGVYSQTDQQWTSSCFEGIATIALAMFAAVTVKRRTARLVSVVAALGLILSLGPVYAALRQVVPSFGFVRYPVKFVVLALFGFPLLAAFGIAHLQSASESGAAVCKRFRGVAIALCLITLLIIGLACALQFKDGIWSATWKNGILRVVFLLLFSWAIGRFIETGDPRRQRFGAIAAILLLPIDISTHAPRQNPTIHSSTYGSMQFDAQMPRIGEARAMLSPALKTVMEHSATTNLVDYYVGTRSVLLSDCNLLDRIPKVDGFYSLYLRNEAEVRALLYGTNANRPLEQFLGVSQIMTVDRMFTWQSRTNFMPLVTGGQRPIFADDHTTLGALASGTNDLRHVVYLPPEASGAVATKTASPVRIENLQWSAHHITFDADATSTAILVVAQSFYHGWKTSVDGAQTHLWRANHAYQAIEIPAGKHHVELKYEDSAFRLGSAISALTLLSCVIGAVAISIRRTG